jgi:hypothetical protein
MEGFVLGIFCPTHPVNILSERKPECTEIIHDFLQSVDLFFSHEYHNVLMENRTYNLRVERHLP